MTFKKKEKKLCAWNVIKTILTSTGMPESILAAAFARIGQSVLHIDRYE